VTVSAGVTASTSPQSVEELLHAADSALYAAKRSGRDRTVVHEQAALDVAR
jgi:PleD family two-component response regulator